MRGSNYPKRIVSESCGLLAQLKLIAIKETPAVKKKKKRKEMIF